ADRVLFSSFFPQNLLRMRRLLPGIPRGILAWPGWMGAPQRGLLGRWAAPNIVHPNIDDADEHLIRRAHANGRRVHVWTVNDAVDMRRLYAAGVDGLFTDDPSLAIHELEAA
ncbi:MAG TPA: glycerophosphodiester phosphodiesterase, partial [Anaerolineaceae bacterium]|nr:glycerophosphodiester phosphodiesterase [Anaerolineaceae bacterium]